MKPCPFCGEPIQPAAVKCRFCGEWLDPSKRPAWSGRELAVLTEQITREVTRQLVPVAGEPLDPSLVPPLDDAELDELPAMGAASFDARDPYAGQIVDRAHLAASESNESRMLGQPAPRGARWQPGPEDTNPNATAPSWEPPSSAAAGSEVVEPPPSATDAIWQAPAWLRPDEGSSARAPVTEAPSWAPPEQPPTSASTSPGWSSATPAGEPAWTPPAAEAPVWTPPTATSFTPTAAAPTFAGMPADDDDEFVDEPLAAGPGPAPVAAPSVAAKPVAAPEPKAQAPKPKAQAPKPKGEDGFDDDDDDDDFGDDFDDDDDDHDDDFGDAVAHDSVIAAPQPRKLPWAAIAGVAGVLILGSAFLFRDALFGAGGSEETDETGEAEVADADAEAEVEPAPTPAPVADPVEPAPAPEPAPPAIPAEELDAKIAEATNLLNRQKHTEASVIIDEILALMPTEARTLSLRSMVELEKQQYDDALATATACIESDKTQPTCWIVIATVEQKNGTNLARALEGYRKYLEFAPDGRFAKSAKREAERLAAKVEG